MQLKYIEIHGFKSFPDKTRITFQKGYTGIVGPNGSGKSNISDAVRWVLGEQSSKSLRGDKMEDVIFAGAELRKPMGFAQVSLCLDNSDGRIADVGDELVVSRRYYRSGDSDYLINGSSVRLRDVREMFMDTGLGRDGYSIIGQNRITEIVASKPRDRREIFEEASGIAKYRFRKNEAAGRLAAAEDNLSRLRDILDELEARIGPLTQQSEKAKRFLELSEQRKSLEITLYCDTIERSRESLREQKDKIDIAANDYREIQRLIDESSQKIEDLYDDNRRRNLEIEGLNSEIEDLNRRAGEADSDSAVALNDIAHALERIEALKEEADALGGSGAQRLEEISRREGELRNCVRAQRTLEAEVEALEAELAVLVRDSEDCDRAHREALERLAAVQARLTDIRVETASARAEISASAGRERAVGEQLPELKSRLGDAEAERVELSDELERIDDEIAAVTNRKNGFELKLGSRQAKYDDAKQKQRALSARVSETENRINVLRDMERTMDGYLPSVRRVSQAAAERRLRGIVGTVASVITVRGGCELAVETALGAAAQNIIVENERAAKDAIAFLKQSRAGRATFLPLDTIKPSRFDMRERLSDEGVVGLASELVTSDARFADIVSSLLGRTVITDDINTASAVAKRMGYRYRAVTLDGQVINAGGSYTGGYSSRQAGFFSRRTEIEKLEGELAAAKKSADEASEVLDGLKRELSALDAEITAADSDLANLSGDRIRTEGELGRAAAGIASLEDAVSASEAELERISSDRRAREELIRADEEEALRLSNEEKRLEEEASRGESGAKELLERRGELSDRLADRRIALAERRKDNENRSMQIDNLRAQGDDAGKRAELIKETIAETQRSADDKRALSESFRAAAAALRETAEEKRRAIESAAAVREQTEKQAVELRREQDGLIEKRQQLASEQARLEERRESLQKEYQSAEAKLWEEYELTKEEAAEKCVSFSSVSELRTQVAGLRNRIRALGAVNVAAIDELKEVSERYGFMKTQVDDVERSRDELLKLISGLEGEMKEIFTRSFNEINARFVDVFSELFGGGSAKLYLTDEEDILESGIEIDAQPPGKVIKNLASLSGGEQSLLAIAIYFAILAVNPSPFCILDEIDSALDDNNVVRFAGYLQNVCDNTQIIAITHRRGTMEGAGVLYGVTMQEEGVSKLLKLNVDEARLVIEK